MHTEEEARTKWCSEARVSQGNNRCAIAENPGTNDKTVCCIASDCAHWRWLHESVIKVLSGDLDQEKARGYCGLSGKP